MASALDSGSGGPGSSPGLGTALCSWPRYFTLVVPLSTQVYKWVPANLLLGVALRWTSIPSRGEVAILLVASCCGNRDELRPQGATRLVCRLNRCRLRFTTFQSDRQRNTTASLKQICLYLSYLPSRNYCDELLHILQHKVINF